MAGRSRVRRRRGGWGKGFEKVPTKWSIGFENLHLRFVRPSCNRSHVLQMAGDACTCRHGSIGRPLLPFHRATLHRLFTEIEYSLFASPRLAEGERLGEPGGGAHRVQA